MMEGNILRAKLDALFREATYWHHKGMFHHAFRNRPNVPETERKAHSRKEQYAYAKWEECQRHKKNLLGLPTRP